MNGIVFWTSYICMHTTSVFEELGKKTKVIIACKSLEYGAFGSMNLPNTTIVMLHSTADADSLIEKTADFVHINNAVKSTNGTEVSGYALKKLLNNDCFVLNVNLEQYPYWGWKGVLRRIQWYYLYNIGIGRKIKGIGCTGSTGVTAFRKAFVPQKRLFDFIYSVPTSDSYMLEDCEPINYNAKPDVVKFAYVGQIIPRKNILETVRVFNSVNEDYTLDIIGVGSQEKELLRLIEGNHRIHYWGRLRPRQVRQIIEHTDVVVLPSASEGWGCTGNEALMAGNRLLVSDRVGSRALVQNRANMGALFHSSDWDDLKHAIENEIKLGTRTKADREKIIEWSALICPNVEANYFIEMVKYYKGERADKPTAPWE